MKKIHLLPVFLFVAQIFVAQEQKIKSLDIDPFEYAQLKQDGKLLAHYEYRFGATNKQSLPMNKVSKITATPCDQVLYTGAALNFSSLDDANAAVSIPFNFCFYGVNYTSCLVSTNGNIQFSTNSTAFSATGFPSTTVNMIAPFWSDCYITSGASVKVDVYSTRMIISWDSIGYYNNHNDKTNSFQCILTDGLDGILPSGKNVGFYYKKMQWTTGDASQGSNGFPASIPSIPATVGMNQGNGIDYTLIGRFDSPGNVYDGPLGNNDGVSWLNGKRFYFNLCTPAGSNVEPVSSDAGYCDTIKICGNDSILFNNKFLGPETAQTINVTVNAPTLSGALTYSVVQGNGISDLRVAINGASATNGYHVVTVTATDNGIPVQSTSYNLVVNVDHSSVNNTSVTITTNPASGICPGQTFTATASISGTAPNTYNWSNGSIATGTTYTLNSVADSLVFLTINTAGCTKTIMSHVHVSPVPAVAIIGNTTICGNLGATSMLTASNTVNYSAQAPYVYNWTSTTFTGSVNSQTINATQGVYSVTITNSNGCNSSGTASLSLNAMPEFTASPSYSISNIGSNVNLDINFGSASPVTCGLASLNCGSPNTLVVGVGTLTNSATGWPSVYGNYYKNARHQMLFTASELLAAGLQAGKISSVSFPLNSIPAGYIGTLSNYSIKLKCINASTLSANFDNTGLTEVFNSNVTPVTGINTHNFSQAYLWDGVSDLLVDVCYSLTASFSSNPIMPYTNVGVKRCLYFYSDGTVACSNMTGTSSNNRPNVIFGNCSSVADPNDYTYSWSPAAGLSDPSIKNPSLTVGGSQVYTVTVTYTNSPNCPAVGTVTIDVPTGTNTADQLRNAIFIYPNPNNGQFEINVPGMKMNDVQLDMQIVNTLGQTIYSTSLTEIRTNIDLKDLNNGVYFITITDDQKQKMVTKIILQK